MLGGGQRRGSITGTLASALGSGEKRGSITLKPPDEAANTKGQGSEMANAATELSPKAELFRSRLIHDFNMLDSIGETGVFTAPKYHMPELMDPEVMNKLMVESPNALVKFQIHEHMESLFVDRTLRRKNRVRNKYSKLPSLDLWASWILESNFFQKFMLFLILSNSIVLGIDSEVGDNEDYAILNMCIKIFDYCSLIMYMLEIILKWLDDFIPFWSSGWNVFDFIVTVQSVVPEVMNMTGDVGTGGLGDIAKQMRIFRVLRSLKMVSRFRQVRLIALAITKAFQSMTFILLLLLTFMYIFAIMGIIFFENYTNAEGIYLEYQNSFSSIQNAFITLIQLFTLDHWHELLMDLVKVANPVLSGFYVILWIFIGSFIFRNIFVGIMVNNFQNIRNDLVVEVQQYERAIQVAEMEEKLKNELSNRRDSRQSLMSGQAESGVREAKSTEEVLETTVITETVSPTRSFLSTGPEEPSKSAISFMDQDAESVQRNISDHLLEAEKTDADWDRIVQENMTVLSEAIHETVWPRDTLFKYYRLMERLQDNLEERMELHRLASLALLQIYDS
ncbi:cation channel sperm-associated protein 2-like isoform X1 [Branchiostoma floridae]|uniref:Cation channel sperm-associated protein 2-like isoform X1 n=2 Tax=Branchiostoma floridae TaxID=7739 RepID=A0A9J7KNE3_BRAFL|nr:cation channel sperm-associated protein 2-like isoform X1 [Branchiostoma floridae]